MRSTLTRFMNYAGRMLGLPPGALGQPFMAAVIQLLGSDLAVTLAGFAFTAALIRLIGPTEFGQANLIVSVALFLLVPVTLGLPAAASKFLSSHRAGTQVATLVIAQFLLLAVTVPALVAGRHFLADRFGVPVHLYLWGLAYAVLLAGQLTVDGVLGGLQEFKKLARINAVAGALFIATTIWLLSRDWALDHRHYIAVNGLRWVVLVALGAWVVRAQIGAVRWRQMPAVFHYGAYQAASALTHFFVLGSIDSLMLNAYHGPEAVGVFAAYATAYSVVISRFMKIFSTVFLPAASAHGARHELLRKTARAYGRAAGLLVPAVMALSFVLFQFYGSAYHFSIGLAALMGLGVTMHVGVAILADLSAAEGLAGVRRNLAAAVLTAVLNVALNLLLIPRWGVAGSMLATAAAFAAGLTVRYVVLVRVHRAAGEWD